MTFPLNKPLIKSHASSLLDGFSLIIPSYTTTSKSIRLGSENNLNYRIHAPKEKNTKMQN
jgi:hypothetical protein